MLPFHATGRTSAQERFYLEAPEPDPVQVAAAQGRRHHNAATGRTLFPQSVMPQGEHTGKIMERVPESYYRWILQPAQAWMATHPLWDNIHAYATRTFPEFITPAPSALRLPPSALPSLSRVTTLSPDRVYRYTLWRQWGHVDNRDQFVLFIGLNPSTADETKDDPTIRKCIGFAKRWGFGALCMANLFARRATKPADMKKAAGDPIGPDNDLWLEKLATHAGLIIAAWGCHGTHRKRDKAVLSQPWLKRAKALRLTQAGHPEHPLYIPYEIQPQPFPPA